MTTITITLEATEVDALADLLEDELDEKGAYMDAEAFNSAGLLLDKLKEALEKDGYR
jgi:hypothetical protein